jgi:type IV pilus assembly protein PilA
MIVVAIIGILAAIAIPSYKDYLARTQLSEAINLTASTKTPLAEWYSDKGYWPADISSISGTNITSGIYTSSVVLDTSDGVGIAVVATMKNSGVNANIQGGTFAIHTTNGAQWTCGELAGSGASAFTNVDGNNGTSYLPTTCK